MIAGDSPYIVVADDGEVGVFATLESLEAELEPEDVPTARAFASDGHPYTLATAERTSPIRFLFLRWQTRWIATTASRSGAEPDAETPRRAIVRRLRAAGIVLPEEPTTLSEAAQIFIDEFGYEFV